MNKIQYIKLLEMRGITELIGMSVAEAVRTSGGDPTLEEMVKVNEKGMIHYINKFQEAEKEIKKLNEKISDLRVANDSLEKDSTWLGYLEAAGVDNWGGYDYAQEMREEDEKNNN